VLSPDDRADEVLAKVQEYLSAGSQAVWVVDPRSNTVTAYGPDQRAHIYRAQDTLEGGNVLPEFRLPLAELFGA
jgi:Uma2 family endonuclease